MVKKFLNAITAALNAEFGDTYEIYTEDVPQGLVPPCFLITMITPQRTKETHVTYRQSVLFAIQYFPDEDENYREELHGVISRLDDCLEIISVDWGAEVKPTLTVATDIAITEGVLTYTLRVEDVIHKVKTGDMMTGIETADLEVRNG